MKVTVSDSFQELTIDYGHGVFQTGMYKTATVSDLVKSTIMTHSTGPIGLYSADGIHFFSDFASGMYGGNKYNATLTSTGWTLKGSTFGYYGNYSTEFVATVPVPAAAWLFGSGLLGLAAARRKSAAKA